MVSMDTTFEAISLSPHAIAAGMVFIVGYLVWMCLTGRGKVVIEWLRGNHYRMYGAAGGLFKFGTNAYRNFEKLIWITLVFFGLASAVAMIITGQRRARMKQLEEEQRPKITGEEKPKEESEKNWKDFQAKDVGPIPGEGEINWDEKDDEEKADDKPA